MAEKSFGVKEINLIGASGTPTIESPNNLNLNAVNVAISTNATIGGNLTVSGTVGIAGTLTYEDVTNVDAVGIITARDGIFISDSKKLELGNAAGSGDLRIYHDANNSFIQDAGTGQLRFLSNDYVFYNAAGNENLLRVTENTGIDLYDGANTIRLSTNDTGVSVTGQGVFSSAITASTYIQGTSSNGGLKFYSDSSASKGVVLNTDDHLVPTNDSASDLGLTGTRWRNLYADTLYGDGSNLTGIAITATPVINYNVSSSGSSAYRFVGGGVDASTNNPDLFLEKGVKYRFNNTTGNSHPFRFRVSSGGSTYSSGVSGAENGVQFFTVPFDAPDTLVYQCTIHGGMVGNIYTYGKTTQCYDIYRLAANFTIPSANSTITASMVRPTLFFEKIGPGMSVSSGVFTFPSTGKYEIQAFFQGFHSGSSDDIFKLTMDATSNNSSYQEVVNCRASNYNSGAAFHASFTYLINITDISTHKVRFGTSTAGSNQVQLDGNSAGNILDGTYFIFKKILDT